MDRPSLRRIRQLASRASEWLVPLLLLAVATPPILLRPQSLTPVGELNLLDGSWLLDTSYKAAGGIWFGRDVAFTYGPLFQWLSSAPSRWLGMSVGAVYATWYTLPFYIVILSTFLTARLLLPKVEGWRRALLVLLAVVYWSPPDLQASLVLLGFALFLHIVEAASVPGAEQLWRSVASAAICITAFLISADTGIYCVAALLLTVLATAATRGRVRQLAGFLLITAIAFAFLVLTVNSFIQWALDFRFWRASLAIAAGYRWFEPLAMAKTDKHLLLKVLVLGMAVFAAAWFGKRLRGDWTRRPAFLLAGFVLAFLTMQSALVRSDHGHVLVGTYAMVFLCGAIALEEFDWYPWVGLGLPVLVVAATIALAQPFPVFLPGSIAGQVRQMLHPPTSCPEGTEQFDRACFPPKDARFLTDTSEFVTLHAAPGSRIAVFRYQTALGIASRHQVAGGVMQGYLVNGEYLTWLHLRGLESANPHFGLYFKEGPAGGVDAVPDLTRSPGVWFYYLRHYNALWFSDDRIQGLLRDDGRDSRIQFADQPIVAAGPSFRPQRRRSTLDLGPVQWPSDGADFIKLRIRVDYPLWWRMRKPSCLTLDMTFADGKHKLVRFVVPPGRATDVWVYPWDDADMGRYFWAHQSDWPARNRVALAKLQLLVTPFDWISVVPDKVTIESVEAVQLTFS
jgi:hypothetical protein